MNARRRFHSILPCMVALLSVLSAPLRANAAGSQPTTIAVLPFTRHSPEEGDRYLENGFAETLTTVLARAKDVNVVERSELKRVMDELKHQASGLVDEGQAAEIGKQAGANQVVVGAFLRVGSTMRVTCRFVDTQTATVISDRAVEVTRRLGTPDDIFPLLDEVANEMLGALGVKPDTARIQEITQATKSQKAFEFYTQAREHYLSFTQAGYSRALPLFEQAVDADETYALAWAGLAETLGQWGWEKEQNNGDAAADFQRALTAAKKAVALNPNLGEAYRALAEAFRHVGEAGETTERRLRRSMEAARKAIELNDQDAEAHYTLFLASGLSLEGEGYRAVQKALQLNPRLEGAHIDLASAYLKAGKAREAMRHLDAVLKVHPKSVGAWLARGNVFLETNEVDDAVQAYRKVVDLQPDLSFGHASLGYALVLQRKFDSAVESCRQAIQINGDLAFAHFGLSLALKAKGDAAGAKAAARRCLQIAREDARQADLVPAAEQVLRELDR